MLRLTFALLCVLPLAGPAAAAADAPLKILTPGYGQAAILALKSDLEKRIGGPVEIEIVGTGGIPERIAKGDRIDLVVTYRESLAPITGRLEAQTDVAISNVAIGTNEGPAPVLRNEAEVASFLKSVPSFARSTSLSGLHMAAVIDRLGLKAVMEAKVSTTGQPGPRIVKGEVAAGAQQISELKLAGVKNIVPLPAALQTDLVITAATVAGSHRAADAARAAAFLASPAAAGAYANAGLKPLHTK